MNCISSKTVLLLQNKGYDKSWIDLAPQEDVKEWLREEHDCIVQVTAEFHVDGINWLVQVLFNPYSVNCINRESSGLFGDNGEFSSYEEALEFGL